jgi:hypothetical protein
MTQAQAIRGINGDLQARQMMWWKHQDEEQLRFYTGLIRERKLRRAAGRLGLAQSPAGAISEYNR